MPPMANPIQPGQSQTFTVKFWPANGGISNQTLMINNNATNYSQHAVSVSLSGQAQVQTSINMIVNPNSLSFGSVQAGASVSKSIEISNPLSSTGPLTVSFGVLGQAFSYTQYNYDPIQPGQSKTITITFHPGDGGYYTSSWNITNNSTNSPSPFIVNLTGQGNSNNNTQGNNSNSNPFGNGSTITESPGIHISCAPSPYQLPNPFDFGSVQIGQTKTKTFVVTCASNSTGPLVFSFPGLSAPYSISPSAGATLSAGQSKTYTITYTPTQAATSAKTLTITHNANDINGTTIPLQITGTGY